MVSFTFHPYVLPGKCSRVILDVVVKTEFLMSVPRIESEARHFID
jgi:hypothetical protein